MRPGENQFRRKPGIEKAYLDEERGAAMKIYRKKHAEAIFFRVWKEAHMRV